MNQTAQTGTTRVFELFLIKPSHYDDEGYVIQWVRSSIPANTLATLNGLALDCAARRVLGEDVEIRITVQDETNTRIRPEAIIRQIRASGGRGLVGLVGVQTNQFPRAVDIARPLAAAGIPVCIGGFHVSGCLAMLPDVPPELRDAMDLGITLFAGEAEGRFEELLQAADRRELKPLYNYMNDLPGLEGVPTPYLPVEVVTRTAGMRTSFDAGRGCPFSCSFCTIINVQGRKSRARNADDVERLVRANLAQGVHNFFITDDNLARNQNWEAIFDRLIHMREVEGERIYVVAQVDTAVHKIRGFIEKAARAGVNRVFLGLESINPETLKHTQKGQNRITEYRAMLQAWHRVGTLTFAGYILGFPGDTPESIEREIRIIQKRAADRPPRVLHPHAAARLRRPQEAAPRGRADGAGPEPLRRGARHDRPRDDVGRRAARDLQEGLEPLLLAGARGTRAAPEPGLGLRPRQHAVEDVRLPGAGDHRRHPSARRRHLPPQVPPRPPSGNAAREPGRVLRAVRRGDRAPRSCGTPRCTGGTGGSSSTCAAPRATEVDVAMQPVRDGDLDALELFNATAGARAAAEKQRRKKAALATAET